jgi:hypothetical protein
MFHDFVPIVSIFWWIKAEKFHFEAQKNSICYDLSSLKLLLGVFVAVSIGKSWIRSTEETEKLRIH